MPKANRPLVALALATLLLSGCATNPVTGKRDLMLLTATDEIAIGEQHYLTSQQSEGGLYSVDKDLTAYVSEVGAKLAAVSDRDLPYEFVVLNNDIPNAWALPGGKIAINRGLLLEMENEAELAAVLAHEIVHAAARHGAKTQSRGVLGQVLVAATAVGSTDTGEVGEIGVLALNLTQRKYGRNAEREADYYGMKYMHAAGYDPTAAVTLQQKFVALSEGEGHEDDWLEGLFATHPPSRERVESNRAALAEFSGGILGRDRYQARLKYLREKQPAYAQAARARKLAEKQPQAALTAVNAAIRQEPRESQFHALKGQILLSQNRNQQATRAYDKAIQLAPTPGYYAHYLGRAHAYQRLRRPTQARADFQSSNNLLPTANATHHLALFALADGDRETAKTLFKSASVAEGEIGKAARAHYAKLDIADQPANYLQLEIALISGEVYAQIQNPTAHHLRDIRVKFQVIRNGEQITRSTTLAALPPKRTSNLPSTIRYRDADQLTADAEITHARTN